MEDQESAKISVKSTIDVLSTSVRKKQAQRVKRNIKIESSRISSYTERKKNSVKWGAEDSNLGPLVYEASVLPTELSFRMKN